MGLKGVQYLRLKRSGVKLKAGDNSHLGAELFDLVDSKGNSLGINVFDREFDRGRKTRDKGSTNIGDISACLRTSLGLGELYKDTDTSHVAVASKHTRSVVLAVGKTQLEATVKAIAGDLNSPFGGFWGFNTPVTEETAEFLNRMFLEGVVAPEYETGSVSCLSKRNKTRFLIETGYQTLKEMDVLGNMQLVLGGKVVKQDREPPFRVRKEAVVVTGNNGNSDISSLDDRLLNDIEFAGNAAHYLNSNLVFFVHNGAIAGLGDACGARYVAAKKARDMLEISAYAALSEGENELWDAVLYNTPFTVNDFTGLELPLRLTAFSDAFYPKPDGFVETTGIDRYDATIGARKLLIEGKDGKEIFIPKKRNFDENYDPGLRPEVVVQPGGSKGDKVVVPLAEQYGIPMVFTMTSGQFKNYQVGGKETGRRSFSHSIG